MNAKPRSVSCEEAPAHWLRRLWERMAALYGHAWVSVHGMSPQLEGGTLTVHGDTWAKVLAGLSGVQLGHGLEDCMTSGNQFPPNAPRFRAMCLQIPTFIELKAQFKTVIYREKESGRPFVRLVCHFLDYDSFRNGDKKASERALKEAYQLASDHLMRGGRHLQEPVAAITNTAVKQPEPAAAEETALAAVQKARIEPSGAAAEKAFAEMRLELGIEAEGTN